MDTTVEQLLQSALIRWSRTDPNNVLLSKLRKAGNWLSDFVGLSEEDWAKLNIPIMLQVHILQAIERAKKEKNVEKTISKSKSMPDEQKDSYAALVSQITTLGFNEKDAWDAVEATESKEVDILVDYILLSPSRKPQPLETSGDPNQLLAVSSDSESAAFRGLVSFDEEARLSKELSKWKELADKERAYQVILTDRSKEREQDYAEACVKAFDRGLFISDKQKKSNIALLNLSNLYRRDLGREELKLDQAQEDNEESSDLAMECLLCMSRSKNQIHLDCMHECFCSVCYADLLSQSDSILCPTCRNPVRESRTLGH
jgi:hypothetical protein